MLQIKRKKKKKRKVSYVTNVFPENQISFSFFSNTHYLGIKNEKNLFRKSKRHFQNITHTKKVFYFYFALITTFCKGYQTFLQEAVLFPWD